MGGKHRAAREGLVTPMSDELADAVRHNTIHAQASAVIVQQQREKQAAEAAQWLQSILRVALILYSAYLFWGWRGAIAALAGYMVAERIVVWLGWLISCGKGGG